MCGIVGYVGTKVAKPILLEGLARLEYRGYDSAGFAITDGKNLTVHRTVGPVEKLEQASFHEGKTETQGIAHTRWATHGIPSEINAHPHRAGLTVLVHNGIIENHAVLRNRLQQGVGVTFHSQTDTEVFALLIETNRRELAAKSGKDWMALTVDERKNTVLKALHASMLEVEGHYAILFLVEGLPGYIFGVQNGAPLVAAHTADGTLIASDIQAILSHQTKVSFMPVNSILVAQRESFEFLNPKTLEPKKIDSETIAWSADRVAKDGYESFMLKEIHQQPMVVADTLSGRLPAAEGESFIWDNPKAHEALWKNVKKLFLIGCGTSYHVAMTAKYFFERWAGLPVEVDLASEFRYRNPLLDAGTVVGVISQSGETADTLAALRLANERGLTTFSVCNVPSSSIMRESGFQYPTKAGPEIGVASTKAFTSQLTVLCTLAQDVARHRGFSANWGKNGIDNFSALARLPHDMGLVLEHAESYMKAGAELVKTKTIFFLGRGPMYPIALEGALKLKEITYHNAEGYAGGELKHGPIAMVDENLTAVVLAPPDDVQQKTLSNLEEIKSRKGRILGIGQAGDKAFERLCDIYIPMPQANWGVAPMLYVVPMQLIAYGLAKQLGRNIDKPRNLAKSVTVE
ncbi:MAG: glutamine--fructose-6-phosphate transaminase (isomerizing) [Bdellovibrionales bacterium]|nr:glutamine--fructose-6-phosphate transaminase (isomerizing) [Bdellovibrionales bacterium]